MSINYKCNNCGLTNVKLWRDPTGFIARSLYCCKCAGELENIDVSHITNEGYIKTKRKKVFNGDTIRLYEVDTDKIGKFIPAVPAANIKFKNF